MKESIAQKAFNKRRRQAAIRLSFLYHALKNRGMDGMKKEIIRFTKAK